LLGGRVPAKEVESCIFSVVASVEALNTVFWVEMVVSIVVTTAALLVV
jgi:hypothetical protein